VGSGDDMTVQLWADDGSNVYGLFHALVSAPGGAWAVVPRDLSNANPSCGNSPPDFGPESIGTGGDLLTCAAEVP
jgi:hypothetical protein